MFFAEHDLPWSITQERNQANYLHAAILRDRQVIAYGQLVPQSDRIYQICQMVVKSEDRGLGLGRKILSFLIVEAKKAQAVSLTLNARLTAVGFYQKLGFEIYGAPFPSTTTQVMHIAMHQSL